VKSRAKPRVARPSHLSKPTAQFSSALDDDSPFKTLKKDKQRIKHSLLLSKAQRSSDKPSGIKKRRRPSKKLVTNLDALADALPDIMSKDGNGSATNAIELKSLQSKPGARKKRDKLDKKERDRFGRNLAVLSQAREAEENGKMSKAATTDASGQTPLNRWAALRQHIAGNMGTTATAQNG
jgi:Ribosome biogenesis protein SLX9